MHTDWNDIQAAITAAAQVGQDVGLYGRPGTGKTFLAQSHGITGPDGFTVVNFQEAMDPAVLEGYYLKGADGAHAFHYGSAPRAWSTGCRFVGNEVHRASGEALSFLLATLDDRPVARMDLPNGETVTPASGFHAVLTTNGDPDDLDPALKDRVLWIEVRDPNPAAVDALDGDLRDLALASFMDMDRPMSLRPWFRYQDFRRVLDRDQAGRLVFGDRWPDFRDTLALASA